MQARALDDIALDRVDGWTLPQVRPLTAAMQLLAFCTFLASMTLKVECTRPG